MLAVWFSSAGTVVWFSFQGDIFCSTNCIFVFKVATFFARDPRQQYPSLHAQEQFHAKYPLFNEILTKISNPYFNRCHPRRCPLGCLRSLLHGPCLRLQAFVSCIDLEVEWWIGCCVALVWFYETPSKSSLVVVFGWSYLLTSNYSALFSNGAI